MIKMITDDIRCDHTIINFRYRISYDEKKKITFLDAYTCVPFSTQFEMNEPFVSFVFDGIVSANEAMSKICQPFSATYIEVFSPEYAKLAERYRKINDNRQVPRTMFKMDDNSSSVYVIADIAVKGVLHPICRNDKLYRLLNGRFVVSANGTHEKQAFICAEIFDHLDIDIYNEEEQKHKRVTLFKSCDDEIQINTLDMKLTEPSKELFKIKSSKLFFLSDRPRSIRADNNGALVSELPLSDEEEITHSEYAELYSAGCI